MKAHRQNIDRRLRNRDMRSTLRTGLKAIRTPLNAGEIDEAKALLSSATSLVDKMAGKGIIHKNTAGRYKSRIAAKLKPKTA
ncbi:MAG: 30S ribosomal protein S20 [Acidobacteria bacterium]|nr:30S ribosomal protein S20 [Acidobacteriota bacterium]